MKHAMYLSAALGAVLISACGGGGGSSPTPAASGLVTGPGGSVVTGVQVTPVTALAASLGEQGPDQEPAAVTVADEADPYNPAGGARPASDPADSEPVALGALPASAADPERPRG